MTDVPAPKSKRRLRFGLRGLMALVVVVALSLVVVLPMFRDRLRVLERYVRVKLADEDLRRHTNVNGVIGFADEFGRAIRAGRFDVARELTTWQFQERVNGDDFRALAAKLGLDQGPCQAVQVTTEFTEDDHRFESSYHLRCGPADGVHRWVKLVVITEGGHLRVDRIEAGKPVVVAP